MMRRIAVLAAAVLAACEGESLEPPMLEGFAPAEDGALLVPATDCTTSFGYTATALLLGFSTYTDICGYVQATGLCGEVASSTAVTVSVLRARYASPEPAPIGAGTYAVDGTPRLEADDSIVVALADITRTGPEPSCAQPTSYPALAYGTLEITAVDAAHVAGTLDVTFSDRSRFQAAFDAPICSHPVDLCDLLASSPSCTAPACCPTATTCP